MRNYFLMHIIKCSRVQRKRYRSLGAFISLRLFFGVEKTCCVTHFRERYVILRMKSQVYSCRTQNRLLSYRIFISNENIGVLQNFFIVLKIIRISCELDLATQILFYEKIPQIFLFLGLKNNFYNRIHLNSFFKI